MQKVNAHCYYKRLSDHIGPELEESLEESRLAVLKRTSCSSPCWVLEVQLTNFVLEVQQALRKLNTEVDNLEDYHPQFQGSCIGFYVISFRGGYWVRQQLLDVFLSDCVVAPCSEFRRQPL